MFPVKTDEISNYENKKVDLNLLISLADERDEEVSTFLTSYDLDTEFEIFNENDSENLNWQKLEYNPHSRGTKFECNYKIETDATRVSSDVDRGSKELFNHKYCLRDLSHAVMYLSKLNAYDKANFILVPNRKFEQAKLNTTTALVKFFRTDRFIFKKMLQLYKLNDYMDQSLSLFLPLTIILFLLIDLSSYLFIVRSSKETHVAANASIDFIASF